MPEIDVKLMRFDRIFRGDASEVYFIWHELIRVGGLELHFGRTLFATVLIEIEMDKDLYKSFVERVYEVIGIVIQDDIYLTTWSAKEIETYSDIVDHSLLSPSRRDLDQIGSQIKPLVGRFNRMRGHLSEHIAREYFEKLGYEVKKGTPLDDGQKVDLLGLKEGVKLLIQVKAGEINYRQIHDCISYMEKYERNKDELVWFTFVANSFPYDIEIKRAEIEHKRSCKILCVDSESVVRALPLYRHVAS